MVLITKVKDKMNIEGNLVNSVIADCQEMSIINIISSGDKGFPGSSVVKNPLANAGYVGLIPGWEDSHELEMATCSSILAWKIPRTEETGMVSQKSRVVVAKIK